MERSAIHRFGLRWIPAGITLEDASGHELDTVSFEVRAIKGR